jgi:hypothetical protein
MQTDDRETVRDLLEAALRRLTESSIDSEHGSEAASTQASSIRACDAHPGHERFPLNEGPASTSARRPCFMEPDRVCVNSGACEMRGF